MIDLRDEIRHDVVCLHLGTEFVAAARFYIKLHADIGQTRHQGFRRGIAVYVGERLVDGKVMALRRGAENAFHCVIEEGAIAGFARRDAAAGIFGHPRQQREGKAQNCHDDEAGNEFAAQIGGDAQPDHQPRHEYRKRHRGAVGAAPMLALQGLVRQQE